MLCNQYDNETGQYLNSFLPDSDPRNAARWLIPAFCTTVPVPDRTPLTWPFWRDGKWVLLPDYRGRKLYRTDTGEAAEIMRAGILPADANLTDKPRPSPDYKWDGKAWIVDPETLAHNKREAAMTEFETRMMKAKTANLGKSDALAAGLLTDVEAALFQAWAKYQMDCVRVIESPNFPDKTPWPDEPDAKAIAAQIEAARKVREQQETVDKLAEGGTPSVDAASTSKLPIASDPKPASVQKDSKTGSK